MSLFITFEGGEGSGKSTQANALYRRLLSMGIPCVLTHEPGGTALGGKLRRLLKGTGGGGKGENEKGEIDPRTELLLFAASRAQLVAEVICPSLEKGIVVISDRYADSTIAYQGYGRGLDFEVIEMANNLATRGLRPDLVVLLDIPVDIGLGRRGSAKKDRFEKEDFAFHQRVREGYLEMARKNAGRWLVVDGGLPRRRVSGLIWERVSRLLSP